MPDRNPKSDTSVPDHLLEELEETEAALAEFYARIPDAVRNLMQVYVTTTNYSLRRRLRGRIAALLNYIEEDQDAGKPPPRKSSPQWTRTLLAAIQNTLPIAMAVFNDPAIQSVLQGGMPVRMDLDPEFTDDDDDDDPFSAYLDPDEPTEGETIDAEFEGEDEPPEPPKKKTKKGKK